MKPSKKVALNAVALFAVAAMASSGAFAYDADTIAFYPFKEGVPGTSAAGVTILNDAGGGHAGTVTMSTDTGVVYHADVPGKYILASSFAANPRPEIVYTDPGCVHFWDGGKITFEGLSTAISSNDDYTIEFFYKIQEEDMPGPNPGTNSYSLRYNVGTYFPGDDTGNVPEGYYPTYLNRTAHSYWQFYYAGYNLKVGGKTVGLGDALSCSYNGGAWCGDWQHIALVYSKDTRELTAWSNYGARNWKKSLSNVTNSVLDVSVPLEIGHSKFRGLVSCLRVSKRALAPDYFLHASHLDAYPETTVFHYKMDGVDGETATTITNYAYGGHPYAGQFWDWDPTKQMKLYSGNATVHEASSTNSLGESVTVGAEWSSLRAFNKALVDDGTGAEPYENGGSGRFHSLERMHEAGELDGGGILLSRDDYQHVKSGSFTIEMTMKLDYTTWLAKMKNVGKWFPVFALYGGPIYFQEWGVHAIMDGDNCFRLTGYAYLPTGHVNTQICNYNGSAYHRDDNNFLKDGRWHHFALVYDDATYEFRLYVDHELKDTQVMPEAYRPGDGFSDIWFASGGKLNRSSFEGWIDEVRMTRKALSPEQFISFRSLPGTLIIIE